jgi:hypothetical protein
MQQTIRKSQDKNEEKKGQHKIMFVLKGFSFSSKQNMKQMNSLLVESS